MSPDATGPVRGRKTKWMAFACALAVSFVFLGFLAPGVLGGFFLRAIGTVSCLYSMVDIYSDILADAHNPVAQNDAIIFAELSGGSAETGGVAWLAISGS